MSWDTIFNAALRRSVNYVLAPTMVDVAALYPEGNMNVQLN